LTGVSHNDSEGRPDFADLANVARIALRGRRRQFEMARMNETLATANERRGRQRFKINAPVTVVIGGREIPAYTRDLSNRGVYFYLALPDGTQIDREFEFVIELPPEITLSTCCRIRCLGRAVRTDKTAMSLTGIAAEILEYSILREAIPTA
jgi:hypothetical protein